MILPGNKTVMIAGGVCVVLLLGEIVALAIGAFHLSKANRTLQHEQQRLMKLKHRSPYPSAINVRGLGNNLDELEYRVSELAAELIRDPFSLEPIEAAEFSARAQNVIERFRRKAIRAGMQLPKSLEVGFAQYASGGAVPQAADVPRLSRQLYSVERVADVLVQSGAISVDAMSRELFEGVDEAEVARRRPARSLPNSMPRKLPPLTASLIGPDGIYTTEQIVVSFTASEKIVWRALDLFAVTPHFMVVSGFSHQTQSEILTYNPDAMKREEESAETIRYLSEGILSGDKALSRSERMVAGAELVSVHLTIEVYNFDSGGR